MLCSVEWWQNRGFASEIAIDIPYDYRLIGVGLYQAMVLYGGGEIDAAILIFASVKRRRNDDWAMKVPVLASAPARLRMDSARAAYLAHRGAAGYAVQRAHRSATERPCR